MAQDTLPGARRGAGSPGPDGLGGSDDSSQSARSVSLRGRAPFAAPHDRTFPAQVVEVIEVVEVVQMVRAARVARNEHPDAKSQGHDDDDDAALVNSLMC